MASPLAALPVLVCVKLCLCWFNFASVNNSTCSLIFVGTNVCQVVCTTRLLVWLNLRERPKRTYSMQQKCTSTISHMTDARLLVWVNLRDGPKSTYSMQQKCASTSHQLHTFQKGLFSGRFERWSLRFLPLVEFCFKLFLLPYFSISLDFRPLRGSRLERWWNIARITNAVQCHN